MHAGRKAPRFIPGFSGGFEKMIQVATNFPRGSGLSNIGTLLKVFWPYITYDTVFDNTRVCEELGTQPVSFLEYGAHLYDFAKQCNFQYPYRPLPITTQAGAEANA